MSSGEVDAVLFESVDHHNKTTDAMKVRYFLYNNANLAIYSVFKLGICFRAGIMICISLLFPLITKI